MEVEEIKLDGLSPPASVNFGPGIELLMNDRKKSTEVKIEDIDALEADLNSFSRMAGNDFPRSPRISEVRSEEVRKVEEKPEEDRRIKFEEVSKSWDGFKSVNTVDPDKEARKPDLDKEEALREKFKYLRRLEELERKGVHMTKKYSMESSLSEMQGEFENIEFERAKASSIKFQGKMLMAIITGLEFVNTKFDPFDVKLDGWAEQINENIQEYDDIFAELHDKYRSKAKLAPELKLLFQLGGSAIMLHMTNTMFKSAIPGMDDIMRQNPELMHKFTQAAVSSMGQTSPGFSGFMSNVIKDRPARVERAEMKGPTDISSILAGLKPKEKDDDAVSVVSMDEPKKSKRRPKSEKNTMVL